jgi:hypothetical protein
LSVFLDLVSVPLVGTITVHGAPGSWITSSVGGVEVEIEIAIEIEIGVR